MAKESTTKGKTDKDDFISIAYLERELGDRTISGSEEEWLERRNPENALLIPSERQKAESGETRDRKSRVILSRLRTGHIDTNAYLYRIKKRVSKDCECGAEEQSVKHAMTDCRFTISERKKGKEHDSILKLLSCKEGLSTAVRIWKEFCRRRKKERGEAELNPSKEKDRGWGELDRGGEEEEQ